MTWQFFATVTVTAFVLLVITIVLGVGCYFNYGKGLAHYLHVTEALEGEDFTPVYFPRHSDPKPFHLGRQNTDDSFDSLDEDVEKKGDLEPTQPTLAQAYPATPPPSSFPKTITKANFTLKSQPIARPRPTLASAPVRGKRGDSVYSDNLDSPIILSSSPPLISDLASPSSATVKRMTRSSTLRKSGGGPLRRLTLAEGNGAPEAKAGSGLKIDVKNLVSIQKPSPTASTTTTISGSSMRQSPVSPVIEERERIGRARALSLRGKSSSPVEKMGGELPSVPVRF
ncbi:hypothetical protein NMY22_g17213 [Coprinellus aureogranulatus]|nr:hypothetical protein NMY22_g17213 [Coprinellus aureogranulatus]